MRIIALKGRAGSGKSTTIGMLPSILATNGYTQLLGSKKNYGKDFQDIYVNGSIKLGITSAGDTYDLVHKRITALVKAGCDTIICACRTYGGTHEAIFDFKGYTSEFIQKTYATSPSAETTINLRDANVVFGRI